MNVDELKYLLREVGHDIAAAYLARMNESLFYLDMAMKKRMIEYAEKDPQGYTQISSILGHIRSINLDETLKDLGFESDIFNKKTDRSEERGDLLIEESITEMRGSLRHFTDAYGVPRGGKYSLDHDKRIYFISREKINSKTKRLESLLFQILFIDSSKFEKMRSKKVNMSQLKKIVQEDLIGEWEVFDSECNQNRVTFGK